MRSAMKLASLGLLILAVACGGGTAPEPEISEQSVESLSSLDEDLRERHLEARQEQRQALETTESIVAHPEGATVEEIEQAMNMLNLALMRGRAEARILRTSEVEGWRPLWKETLKDNKRLLAAYEKLQASHPDPSPDMLKQELSRDS